MKAVSDSIRSSILKQEIQSTQDEKDIQFLTHAPARGAASIL